MRVLKPDLSITRPAAKAAPFSVRSDASVRDSVRVLSEVVTHLCERIEILEARELLSRTP